MKYLDQWNEERRKKAGIYTEKLASLNVVCPVEEDKVKPVYHLYVIRTQKRNDLQAFLKEKGIETLIHYPIPIHLQKAYEDLGYRKGDLLMTERCSREVLSLPLFPELKDSEMEKVTGTIRLFFKRQN